jgi:hypothetical protein
MKKRSSYDAVNDHMLTRGWKEPVDAALHDDLERVVRRVDVVRSLGAEYGEVELSPYMQSLLGVSTAAQTHAGEVRVAVAASV